MQTRTKTSVTNGLSVQSIMNIYDECRALLCNSKQPETNELMCNALFKRGLTLAQIATMMHVNVTQVDDWINRPDLPLSIESRRLISIKLAVDGAALEEIDNALNASSELVEYWIAPADVPRTENSNRLTAISLTKLDYSRNRVAALMGVSTDQVESWISRKQVKTSYGNN